MFLPFYLSITAILSTVDALPPPLWASRDRARAFVAAEAPEIAAAVLEGYDRARAANTLPKRYLEIAIVVVSKLNECHYCVAHHKPFLAVEGLSPDGIDRLLDADGHPELDDIDRLVEVLHSIVRGRR